MPGFRNVVNEEPEARPAADISRCWGSVSKRSLKRGAELARKAGVLPGVRGVGRGAGMGHPGSRAGAWVPGVTEGLEPQAPFLGLGRMDPKEQAQRRSCVPPPRRGAEPTLRLPR